MSRLLQNRITDALGPAQRGALFYLGHYGAFAVVIPFLNVYLAQIGLNGRQIGLLAALFPAMTLLLAPGLVGLADRYRKRVVAMMLCAIGTIFTLILFGLTQSFGWLFVIMLAYAIIISPIFSLADGLIAQMAGRHHLNYGGMRLWGSIGFATVAIISGAVWQQVGYLPMFVVGSLATVPVIWLAYMLEEGSPLTEQIRQPFATLFHDRGLVVILVATFLVGLALGSAITFDGIYMDALGGGELMIGLLLGLSAYSELPTMQFSNRIYARLQGPKTLLLAYGLFGAAFVGYILVTRPWMLLLMAMLKGLGFGLFLTTTIRMVDDRVPEAWAATAQSLLTAVMMGLAMLVASLVGGVVWDLWGITAVYLFGSVAVGLAMGVILIAGHRGLVS